MLKAVLCDIDGTLVDSNTLHAEAWMRTFAKFGYNFSLDDLLHQIGKGGDQLIPHYIPSDQLPQLKDPMEKYRKELFHAEYFGRIRPFPGARALLQKMRAAGLKATEKEIVSMLQIRVCLWRPRRPSRASVHKQAIGKKAD